MQSIVPWFPAILACVTAWSEGHLLLAVPSLSEMWEAKCEIVSIIRRSPAGRGLIITRRVTCHYAAAVVQSVRMRRGGKMCHKVSLS